MKLDEYIEFMKLKLPTDMDELYVVPGLMECGKYVPGIECVYWIRKERFSEKFDSGGDEDLAWRGAEAICNYFDGIIGINKVGRGFYLKFKLPPEEKCEIKKNEFLSSFIIKRGNFRNRE